MLHHKDDKKWIDEQLRKLPGHLRAKASDAYSSVYAEAMSAEPEEHKKENAARFSANSRLRIYVGNVLRIPYPTTRT